MDIMPEIQELGLADVIHRIHGMEEAELCGKVVDFFFGEENGQCRKDVKWRYHDLAGVKLGHMGSPLPDEQKSLEINEIYVGQASLNRTYTIYDGSYVEFIADTLHHHLGDDCLFLPSKNLNRNYVYRGQLAAILHLLNEYWDDFYEFTIAAENLKWMVDYNHHHAIVIYGDREAARAKFLAEDRRKWQDRVLTLNLYPKHTKPT